MKKIMFLLILLVSVNYFTYSQNPTPPESLEFAKQGMKLFEQGKYNDAIEQYKKGRALAPSNSLFSYEIALSYFSLKNYSFCIATLDSVMGRSDANDQFYQLQGDAYDMAGKADTALIIYEKGMVRFPKAANLSMECGALEFARKNYVAAHNHWLTGIAKNPSFADNYYHLAKFYADSSNRIPAILYSETYLNLTRNSAQVAEINKLLCVLYGKSIQITADSTLIIRFSDDNKNRKEIADSVKNFCDAVNKTFLLAGISLKNKKVKAGVHAVNTLREAFIKIWVEQKYNLRFPFSLFDYEKLVLDAGYFYSYSQWLLIKCNMFEFQRWFEDNKKTYTAFVDWYKNHPFNNKITQEIYLCR